MPGTLPIVGDFLQFRVDCQANDQLSENVLHYVVGTATGGGLDLQQMANAMASNLSPVYRAWLPITASFTRVTAQNLTPPASNPSISVGIGGIGTASGNLMPRQASGLIRYQTALGGRANRGRSYIGFIAGSSVDNSGELNGGGTALLASIGAAIGPTVVLVLGGLSNQLLLMVRHPNFPGPPPFPAGTVVTSVQATALIATQRRRGDFGASNL